MYRLLTHKSWYLSFIVRVIVTMRDKIKTLKTKETHATLKSLLLSEKPTQPHHIEVKQLFCLLRDA